MKSLTAAGPISLASSGGSEGAAVGETSPCQRSDVREWQHLDPLTGDRLRARLQTDRWIVGQTGRYDKVVDSCDITAADGRQHTQHKQLEMLQARTLQGSMQVVKTRVVSSQRWNGDHHLTSPAAAAPASFTSNSAFRQDDYNDLQSSLYPLNSNFQRERAGLGRNGFIATRRPPTRIRNSTDQNDKDSSNVSQNVSQNSHNNIYTDLNQTSEQTEIYRSNSTEDLSSLEKINDEFEEFGEWKRVSKLRRSLQMHSSSAKTFKSRPIDLPNVSGKVTKICLAIENKASSKPPVSVRHNSSKNHNYTTNGLQETRHCLRNSLDEETNENSDLQPHKNIIKDDNDDGIVVKTEDLDSDTKSGQVSSYVYGMETATTNETTGSLETRRAKEEDWHSRRKSYGFESCLETSPVSSAMIRSDTSTDSGICRSTELTTTLFEGRGTVVTLGSDSECLNGVTTIPVTNEKSSTPIQNDSSYHRQQHDDKDYFKKDQSSDCIEYEENDASGITKRSKKVEFCKTEVHFAVDSGRVNIVETDGKPPPTQNFRRRRRVTTLGIVGNSETKANLPLVHFGDDEQIKLANEGDGELEKSFKNLELSKAMRRKTLNLDDISSNLENEPWGVKLRHISPKQNNNLSNENITINTPKSESNNTLDTNSLKNSTWSSVAERIREMENRSQGFSTKINFGSGKPIVETTRDSVKGRISQEWNQKPSESVIPNLTVSCAETETEKSNLSGETAPDITKPKSAVIDSVPSILDRKNNLRQSLEGEKIITLNPLLYKSASSRDKTNLNKPKFSRSSPTRPKPQASPTRSISPRSKTLVSDRGYSDIVGHKSPHLSPIRRKSPRSSPVKLKSPLSDQTRSASLKIREKSPYKKNKTLNSSLTPNTLSLQKNSPSGFRQLSEHELKYFGIKGNKSSKDHTHENNRVSNQCSTSTSKYNETTDYVNISKSRNDHSSMKKQKNPKSPSKHKIKTSPIYQNIPNITKLRSSKESNSFENELLLSGKEMTSPNSSHTTEDSSPTITETPKGRPEKCAEEKRERDEDSRRRHQNTLFSKGMPTLTSPTKKSSEHSRSKKNTVMSPIETKSRVTENHIKVLYSKTDADSVVDSKAPSSGSTRRQRINSQDEEVLKTHCISSDDEQHHKSNSTFIRRHRRHERSCERRTPLPEFHHKPITSKIRSVAEKAAAMSTQKSDRSKRIEQNECGND